MCFIVTAERLRAHASVQLSRKDPIRSRHLKTSWSSHPRQSNKGTFCLTLIYYNSALHNKSEYLLMHINIIARLFTNTLYLLTYSWYSYESYCTCKVFQHLCDIVYAKMVKDGGAFCTYIHGTHSNSGVYLGYIDISNVFLLWHNKYVFILSYISASSYYA